MAKTSDQPVLKRIQELAHEEHKLFEKPDLSEEDRVRLRNIDLELDQCWDFLRQRRALRAAGRDPDEAELRPPEVVEKYTQ